VWQALIGAIVTIVLAYMQRRTQRAVDKNTEETCNTIQKGHEQISQIVQESMRFDQLGKKKGQ
jgi:hypothetical protein